jgi:rhamnosyltransferase
MITKMLEEYGNYAHKNKVGIVAPRSIFVTEGRASRAEAKPKLSKLEEVELIHTSGNLVKASVFARVGFFREEFFIDQVDYEFCFRLRKAGLLIIVAAGPVMHHRLGDLRSARFLNRQVFPSNHSACRRYYMARNALVLSREVRDWQFIRRSCSFFLRDSIKILLYENSKRAKLWYMLKGIWDGVCGKLGPLGDCRETVS